MTSVVAPRAGRREWIGLAVIALPCLIYSMDLTVLHMAVPQLSADLRPSAAELLWIIDIYGFLVAGALIPMGTLGDRIGRRRLLLVGAAAFGGASVLAAFAPSAEALIAARALLGITGATVAPSTLSLIRNMFLDPQQRTLAIGVWITSYSLGGVIGPLVGGVLLESFWWGSVFLIAVPVMLLLLAVGPSLLPEYKDPNAGRPDVTSAALSVGAILTVIYGLKRIAQDGVGPLPLLAIGAGAVLGALFVRRQLTLSDPLIDLRLFRVPSFAASLATYGLSILVLFGGFLFLPQFLQLVVGLTPFTAGVWTMPWAGAFIVGSMLTPAVSRRIRPGTLMAGGLLIAAVGFGMLTTVDARTGLAMFATSTFVLSIGMAPVFTLATDLVVGSAPPERAGAAAAISETSAELGGALGIALFGSIGVAVYRVMMADVMPAGLAPDAVRTAAATLGGAIEVAGRVTGGAGAELAEAARAAFVRGLRLCAAISAGGAVGLAVLAGVSLRKLRASGATTPADAAADAAADATAGPTALTSSSTS